MVISSQTEQSLNVTKQKSFYVLFILGLSDERRQILLEKMKAISSLKMQKNFDSNETVFLDFYSQTKATANNFKMIG